METDRRGMLGAIFGSLAGIAGVGSSETQKPTGERAFFKYDGEDWRRIAFEELKEGDRVFQVDFGETLDVKAYRVNGAHSFRKMRDGSIADAITTEEDYDVMPNVWGVRTDETACSPPAVQIESGSIDEQYIRRLNPGVIVYGAHLSEADQARLEAAIRENYRSGVTPSFVLDTRADHATGTETA